MLINYLEDESVVLWGNQQRGEEQQQPLVIPFRDGNVHPKHPSGSSTSATAQRRACSRQVPGLEDSTTALLCTKQSLGTPVLSSNRWPQSLSKKNLYSHWPQYKWREFPSLSRKAIFQILKNPHGLHSDFSFTLILCNHRTQEFWDLPPLVGVWIKTRCPAPIL